MSRPPTKAERGYGPRHQALRQQWETRLNRGEIHTCAKCGKPVSKYDTWDLGHTDDRTDYTGPEHMTCNRSAGAKNSAKVRQTKSALRQITVRDW